MTTTFHGVDEFATAAGSVLGTSSWTEVTQERVDQFAEATGDHQWIHVDVERAARGPFGGTIAHGYLTVSMVPTFLQEIYVLEDVGAVLNYGLGSVRFPHPVRVGARVRGVVTLEEATPSPAGLRVTLGVVVEIDGVDKPACVATVIHLVTAT